MKKLLFFAAALLSLSISLQAQTLSIGNYDDYEEWDSDLTNPYDGSAWEVSPMNLYYTNSGTQILFQKSEVSELAGKNITSLSFKPYFQGAYITPTVTVKVWISETDDTEFYYDTALHKYKYFAVDTEAPLFSDDIELDGFTYDYSISAPIELAFSEPFYYSGDKNLVITISAEGATETTDGAFYINFGQSDLRKRALTFALGSKTLSDVLAGDLWAEEYGVSVINAPDMQFAYEEGTPPVLPKADLEFTASTADEEITLGNELPLSFTVKNNGDGDAANVNVQLYVNDELADQSNTHDGLDNVTIAAGAEKEFTFTYTPTAEGELNVKAVIVAENEENTDNNTVTKTVQVLPVPVVDVTVTGVVVPETVKQGEDITAQITIKNQGNTAAENVVVTLKANGETVATSSDVADYQNLTLAADEEKTVTLTCAATAAGTQEFTAEVSATDDADDSNNSTTITITVEEEVNAIIRIQNGNAFNINNDTRIYSINGAYMGTQLNSLTKGIYVMGGKKGVVK